MFNSLMPSLNIRSLPFVVFMGGFPSRLQNLSSGAIRPGGLLLYLFREMSIGNVSSSISNVLNKVPPNLKVFLQLVAKQHIYLSSRHFKMDIHLY